MLKALGIMHTSSGHAFIFKIIITALSVCLTVGCTLIPDLTEKIDHAFASSLDETDALGAIAIVAKDGKVIYQKALGYTDPSRNNELTIDATVDYLSVGKHFTSVMLLRQQQQGLLSLDESVNKYIPSADMEGETVTVRQLLNMTSGLWEADEGFDEVNTPATHRQSPPPGSMIKLANEGKRYARPGETWLYANSNFMFAALVAESAIDAHYSDLMTELIAQFDSDSSITACSKVMDQQIPVYIVEDRKYERVEIVNLDWYRGSGSVCGSMTDLVNWWNSLRAERILSKTSLSELFTPAKIEYSEVSSIFGYGLGVRIGEYLGHRKIGHTGSASGNTSVLAEYPESGLVIAVSVNARGETVPEATDIEAAIAKLFLEELPIQPQKEIKRDYSLLTGLYQTPSETLCIKEQNGELMRNIDKGEFIPLFDAGNRAFTADPDDASLIEYFLPQTNERAMWSAYDWLGFPQGLAIRIADVCN